MADYQTVLCQLTKKYNLGNYEMEEITVMMSARCGEGEDPNDVYTALMHRCHAARDETEITLGIKKVPAVTRRLDPSRKKNTDYDF